MTSHTSDELSTTGRSPATDDRALWVLAGQALLVVTVFVGFGATQELVPRMQLLLIFLPTAVMIMAAPAQRYERLVVSVPVLLYLSWWALSATWAHEMGTFILDSQVVLPLTGALIIAVCYLPRRALAPALLVGCYVTILWTILFTLMSPDLATVNEDGVPGWRGGFIHKNAMAPFMLFAILTVASFERHRLRRGVTCFVAVFFILMAQSTTSLIVGACLLGLLWAVRLLARTAPQHRASVLTTVSVLGLGGAVAASIWLPSLALAFGKDPTLTSRTDIWAGVIKAIANRPITGYGIGGVWPDQAAPHTRAIQQELGFVVFHTHNGFLDIALHLGLVGLGLFLVLLGSFLRSSLRLLDVDRTLATYFILFAGLIVVASISEVLTFGVWLALLCAFLTLALRLLNGRAAGAVPAPGGSGREAARGARAPRPTAPASTSSETRRPSRE
jgi:exopolysaccharide production protein ExoQ